jgi:hypothetical protein
MNEVDKVLCQLPLLINDFFRHLHRRYKLRVFLCGRKPGDHRFDLRMQIKALLAGRMGCDPFLGEDIAELHKPKVDRDHLTIEVQEAIESDLIIMFLGSPGTLAELTAFAMNEHINRKTVVFNDARHKDERSFINLGPLRLLPKGNVVYFDNLSETPSVPLLRQLDVLVGRAWFQKHVLRPGVELPWSYEQFAVLATIYATYPVRYKELHRLCPLDEHAVGTALKGLFQLGHIVEKERKYLPTRPMQEMPLGAEFVSDIARARTALLDCRLRDPEAVADYHLVV